MANLKGWLNSGWEKISCTIIGNKVALDVVPRDLDGGVIGGSDAPSHTVIVDENGPLLTEDNPGNVVLRGNDGSIMGLKYNIVTSDLVASDLDTNDYTFNPTVDAVEVLNTGVTDLTVTIQSMGYVIVPDEVRVLSLPAKIGLVSFSAGAVFRMNGLNRG